MRTSMLLIFAIALIPALAQAQPTTVPTTAPATKFDAMLQSGHFDDAQRDLLAQLSAHPADQQARFSLGVTQFLIATQHFSHTLYSYGFEPGRDAARMVMELPIPQNPNPQPITYDNSRQLVAAFIDDLTKAQQTLSQVNDPTVKLPLHVGLIRLDIRGDGNPDESESLWHILAALRPDLQLSADDANQFLICFDTGDAHWLAGYSHLLMALGNMILGYDEHDLFNATAPLFYANAVTTHPFLNQREPGGDTFDSIVDAIAFIHLIHFPVADPQRLKDALAHLHGMTAESRTSWQFIQLENDDDHEWIPNPRQHSVIKLQVTQPMIDGWLRFLDEADSLLNGKSLIPFWRGTDNPLGVNLNKVFTQPQPFDLILWVQGTGAQPFLEPGNITNKDIYRNLEAVFNGDIFTFAAYFN